MNLRVALSLLVLLWADISFAQDRALYAQPEYKIKYRDTVGTYIQLVNYFDRTIYNKSIFLKKTISDNSAQYIAVPIDSISGIGVLTSTIETDIHIQIAKTLEIKNIKLKKNALNRIEIRSEMGFVSLPLKWGRTAYKTIYGNLVNAYDSVTTAIRIPSIIKSAKGKYYLTLNTIPPVRKTIYLKPSSIYYNPIYKSIPFQISNAQDYGDYKLFYSYYPYKKYKKCQEGKLGKAGFEILLQPKKLYRLEYRKKGKRRFKKKKFYMDISMEVFIMELD